MGQLMTLLNGALEARGKVLVKLNVAADQFDAVLAVLPSAKSPTVTQLANGGYAIESVVEKAEINRIIPALTRRRRDRPARDPDQQDRPLMRVSGETRHTGPSPSSTSRVGSARSPTTTGIVFVFHCVEIADGTRSIAVGTPVRFDVLAKLGRYEAADRRVGDRAWRRPRSRARIIDVILALGPGEVTTYGDIAEVAGYPKRSRLVGRILATTALDVPWWRVVNVSGRLVPGHEREQAQLLRAEGVVVRGGHVRSAPIGRFTRRPDGAERRRALDLHEREPDVGERVAHRRRVVAESVAEPLDEAGDGVDGQRRAAQIGRIGRQVDRGQLVQAHHVVGDHDLGRHLGQAGLRLAECLRGRRRRAEVPSARADGSPEDSSLTCATLPTTTEAKWGQTPTRPHRRAAARQTSATGSMLMIATVRRPTTSA